MRLNYEDLPEYTIQEIDTGVELSNAVDDSLSLNYDVMIYHDENADSRNHYRILEGRVQPGPIMCAEEFDDDPPSSEEAMMLAMHINTRNRTEAQSDLAELKEYLQDSDDYDPADNLWVRRERLVNQARVAIIAATIGRASLIRIEATPHNSPTQGLEIIATDRNILIAMQKYVAPTVMTPFDHRSTIIDIRDTRAEQEADLECFIAEDPARFVGIMGQLATLGAILRQPTQANLDEFKAHLHGNIANSQHPYRFPHQHKSS